MRALVERFTGLGPTLNRATRTNQPCAP